MSKKLKIGFFTDTYFPQKNGVVTSTYYFKKQLESMGHDVYVLTPHVPGYKDEDKNIIRFRSAKAFFHPELRFPTFIGPRGLKKVYDLKLDIAHSHSPLSLGLMAEFITSILRIPHVHTYHTIYPEYIHYLSNNEYVNKIVSKYLAEKALFIFLNRCDYIIAPSNKVSNYLQGKIKTPIQIQPSGIPFSTPPTTKEKNKIERKYNLKPEDNIIIWTGRMGVEKNIDLFYEIGKYLINKDKNIKILMIGDGPLKPKFEQQIKDDNIQDNFILTGYIDNKYINHYYSISDLLLFTSYSENFSITILESLAASLPIVTVKDESYTQTVINDVNGYQIDSKDPVLFAKTILEIFNDPDKYQRLSTASRNLGEKFSIKNVSQQLLNFYYTLLD